MGNWKVSIFKT